MWGTYIDGSERDLLTVSCVCGIYTILYTSTGGNEIPYNHLSKFTECFITNIHFLEELNVSVCNVP